MKRKKAEYNNNNKTEGEKKQKQKAVRKRVIYQNFKCECTEMENNRKIHLQTHILHL